MISTYYQFLNYIWRSTDIFTLVLCFTTDVGGNDQVDTASDSSSQDKINKRRKRMTSSANYVIETYAIVDYALYQK